MGLYYKLSNGEQIEIRTSDTFKNGIDIILFSGSMILTYQIDSTILLNDIIAEVEEKYNDLSIEDKNFEYSCWCD